ncbi:Uncharacterised protein [Candidatus Norongarragalina meridionalis]|nr:Uncharacterised protein [Candidatus Norongarragalina meridionalis]
MVYAVVNITEEANRVLNIVKAKYGLRDKSQAICQMAQEYDDKLLEPELRPEYVKKAKRIMREKSIHVGSMGDFKKRYG